jgi:DNA repair ATPase RecN
MNPFDERAGRIITAQQTMSRMHATHQQLQESHQQLQTEHQELQQRHDRLQSEHEALKTQVPSSGDLAALDQMLDGAAKLDELMNLYRPDEHAASS